MLNRLEGRRLDATPLPAGAPRVEASTRVLIVTGDKNLSSAVTRVLEQEGYDVMIARHAGHAFLAAITGARIDILISELTLDDMTGEALAATLRRHHPALLSLYISDRPVRQSPRGLLVRPFTRDELLSGLNTLAPSVISPAS